MTQRIDIRDLALMLGPGEHDISEYPLIISDGAGRELTLQIEGTVKVEPVKVSKVCEDEPIEIDIRFEYEQTEATD